MNISYFSNSMDEPLALMMENDGRKGHFVYLNTQMSEDRTQLWQGNSVLRGRKPNAQ